jgi:hypothetical protein
MIQRLPDCVQHLFFFLPYSFILPHQNAKFMAALKIDKPRTYIVKPDGGSLGQGIRVIRPHCRFLPSVNLAIAQEYIESRLHDRRKFDLRVYVLVAQISPLRVYVYRDGIARVCSQDYGQPGVFSDITNTAVNRQNKDVLITEITKLISTVFSELGDVEAIWAQIDAACVRTIAAAYGYLKDGEEMYRLAEPYPRCFQILGFDVLLDQQLRPHILEVNYRPSLDHDIPEERQLKQEMLAAAMRLAAPYAAVQRAVPPKNQVVTADEWRTMYEGRSDIAKVVGQVKERIDATIPKFHPVYPSKDKQMNRDTEMIMRAAIELGAVLDENGLPEIVQTPP